MATRTGRLFHDQNLNAHVNGTVSVKADFTGQNKARAGKRKPLGDLSNAGKPINQEGGTKPLDLSFKSKNLTGITNESNRRGAVNKASENSQTGSRKALGDISNLVPVMKNKSSLKMSSLAEEPLHPSAIAEERFSHNHRECIKSQSETVMDMHHFFRTVGLENDPDDHKPITLEQSANSKLKSESAYNLELEEVPEQLLEVQPLSAPHGSPAYCKTPKLPSYCAMWNNSDVNFKLMETP